MESSQPVEMMTRDAARLIAREWLGDDGEPGLSGLVDTPALTRAAVGWVSAVLADPRTRDEPTALLASALIDSQAPEADLGASIWSLRQLLFDYVTTSHLTAPAEEIRARVMQVWSAIYDFHVATIGEVQRRTEDINEAEEAVVRAVGAAIAFDVRRRINAAHTATQALEAAAVADDQSLASQLESLIQETVRSALRVVEDVRIVTQSDSGSQVIARPMQDVLNEVARQTRDMREELGIALESGSGPDVLVDAGRVHVALIGLVRQAADRIRAQPVHGASIWLEAAAESDQFVTLLVRESGFPPKGTASPNGNPEAESVPGSIPPLTRVAVTQLEGEVSRTSQPDVDVTFMRLPTVDRG